MTNPQGLTAHRRLLVAAWVGTTVLALGSIFFGGEVAGNFAGHAVRVRPWMVTYNLVVDTAQLVSLSLFTVTAASMTRGRGRTTALVAFSIGVALVLAQMAVPLWLGSGPWPPGTVPLQIDRALIFSPSVLRALGAGALAIVLVEDRFGVAIALLLLGDAVLVVIRWATTPTAVMAVVHPYCTSPWGLLPWLAATLLLLWRLLRLSRAPG